MVAIIAACGSPNATPDNVPMEHGFKDMMVSVTADADKAVKDRPITLTAHCLPRITGKGWIRIYASAFNDSSRVIVESPMQDTLLSHWDDTLKLYVLAEFTANKPFEQKWRIRLPDGSAYAFSVSARMDSVYIADSARMFHANSEIVRRHEKVNVGYTHNAVALHKHYPYL